jgi:hypothetical protein
MFEYLSYILLLVIIIILVIFGYFKAKYGFWIIQPVFHVYDISYMLFPPGIIEQSLPKRNKYTNFKNIKTIVYKELTDFDKSRFVNFISYHYLQNKDNHFNPKNNNIIPYFNGHNDFSFFSFYRENEILLDLKKGTMIDDSRIIGVMTSRPIHIFINKGEKDSKFYAYYVDYLCVDKQLRKKGIAPQIIQTHHYNQRHINKNISVSLFKREDELTGIVPLCVYSTYGFSVNKWCKPNELHSIYKFIEINEQNFHFLYDFMKNTQNKFEIIINTEVSNIIELIKTKNIFIFVLLEEDTIISAYFYRKSCVYIEKNMEVLSCFSSINNTEDAIFIQGFKISFWKIAEKNYFGFAAIENISHNQIIIDNIVLKTKPLIISPTAYFFYNFAYPTFDHKKVFILT